MAASGRHDVRTNCLLVVVAPFVFIDADVEYLRKGRIIFSPDRTDFDFYKRIVGQGVQILFRDGHCQWRKNI